MSFATDILVFTLCFSLFSIKTSNADGIPAMFIFGDSLADAGTNNYINTTFRGNIESYGMTYFPEPTGRFTDGRTFFDFIATNMDFGLLPPYLEPGADFSEGINFASGGSGALDATFAKFNITSLSAQVSQFAEYVEKLKAEMGEAEAKTFIANSLFAISTGGNDITQSVIKSYCLQKTLVPWMIGNYTIILEKLYFNGARNFLLVNIPPVGCAPGLSIFTTNKCLNCANNYAKEFNTFLDNLVNDTIIVANTYDFMSKVVDNGTEYGFIETGKACCGNFTVPCGEPGYKLCENPSNHVFWDFMHGTEKMYELFAEEFWNSLSSITMPFNFKSMFNGKPLHTSS